jgi:hypothetical protein
MKATSLWIFPLGQFQIWKSTGTLAQNIESVWITKAFSAYVGNNNHTIEECQVH